MKKYLFCLLTLCFTAASLPATAAHNQLPAAASFSTASQSEQTPDRQSETPHKQRMNRRQLAEFQAKYTAKVLKLDEATTEKYVKTYCEMMEEIWKIAPRGKGNSDSEEEAKKAIEERFVRNQKILQLREKYYKIYSTFLTPKQIQQAYRLERQNLMRFAKRQRSQEQNASQQK